jgi:hypothetical protein
MTLTKILPFVLGTSALCVGSAALAQTAKPAAPAAAPAAKPAAAAPAAKPAAAPAAAPAGAPPAAAATPPAPPTPSKELEAFMKPFEGTWKCESTFPPGAFGPAEVKAKATAKFKKDMGGFFWKGDYSLAKAKDVPPMSAQFWIGYAKVPEEFTMTAIDSMGGTSKSSGKLEGDTVTFTGEAFMMGQKVKVRETLWHKDKAGGHTMEVDMGKGWMPFGKDECKK